MCFAFLGATASDIGIQHRSDSIIFRPHWTLTLQGGVGETVGEADFKDLLTPAFSASVGYNFNKALGVELKYTGNKARGGYPATGETYEWTYSQFMLAANFDLDNIICGYRHDRKFNSYAFLGVGLNSASGNEEAINLAKNRLVKENLWDGTKNSSAYELGLGLKYRLNSHLSLNMEVNSTMITDKFNSKNGSNPDWQINALMGLTFTLGKSYKAIPLPEPVVEEILPPVVENEKPAAEETSTQDLRQELPEQPAEEVKEEKTGITENIFFKINEHRIRECQMEKIERLIAYMNENPESTVEISGYADEKTGGKDFNMKLSRLRAEAVSRLLQERGISSSRIQTKALGDSQQPFERNEDNRVSICVSK